MSLLISWGEIVAFQTYRLYFSGTGQNSGTRGGRARPLFPFLLPCLPQRASPPGPTSLVP